MRYQRFRRFAAPTILATAAGLAIAAPPPLTPEAGLLAGTGPRAGREDAAGIRSLTAAQADLDGNRLFDDLEARLSTAAAAKTLDVVVRYRPGREPARIAGADRGERRLALDHSIATRLTPGEIQRLLASDAVVSIEADTIYHAVRDTAERFTGSTKASLDFDLSGDGDGEPDTYSPQDHTIAILDTGIDGQHQDFAGGKIIAWQDFVNGSPEPYDDHGHGTHVASIAAGAVNAAGVGGMAPAAALVGLKVLDDEGAGTASAITEGLEWCIDNRAQYGIEVINLSLGGDRSSAGTDLLSRTVNRAVAAGIVVCVAAGNEGPRQRTIGSPAAASESIAVGSVADPREGGFYLDPFSSRGPTADGRVKPDLCAPGERISAARANSRTGYARFSGTRMAAPFVAGVAALIRQANPNLTAVEVKTLLKETAVHFGPAGENNEFGAGRLDAYAALEQAAGGAGAPPAVPGHVSGSGRLEGSNDSTTWQLAVSDTGFPVAATLVMQSTGANFDLQIFDPSGRLIASSTSQTRQETIAFRASVTGTYTLVVLSISGSGDYSLDVSAGSEAPLRELE
jgi:serine protease AprX